MPILFATTLFISAILLFLVQPMIAKMILPMLGGAPGVWNTCMLFFQGALLAGYAYVHTITARLGIRRQVLLHMVLLFLPLLVLPIGLTSDWVSLDHTNPIPWLLAVLTVSIGLPFFVLSTSAPLLQKWFAATDHPSAKDPYALYAASNLGSMLALLGYSVLIEPYFPLKGGKWLSQSWMWSFGYALLAILISICAWIVWWKHKSKGAMREQGLQQAFDDAHASSLPPRLHTLTLLHWVALAFVPSSLMLGATTHITLNIAAIPLLWVIPLALYLLSFILVFAKWPLFLHRATVLALPPVLLLLVFIMMPSKPNLPSWVIILIHLVTLFVVATVCHGELSQRRPPTKYLAVFYLSMALGGVLGGIFNALIAPLVFNSIVEYQLALVLASLVSPRMPGGNQFGVRRWSAPQTVAPVGVVRDIAWAAVLGAVAFGLFWLTTSKGDHLPLLVSLYRTLEKGTDWFSRLTDIESSQCLAILTYGLPLLLCCFCVRRPIRFGLGLGAILLAVGYASVLHDDIVLHQERTFFGVLKVELNRELNSHKLFHGTVKHGEQSLDLSRRLEPLSYYHRTGPIGQVFDTFSGPNAKAHIAVIGLGSGTLVSYMERGQSVTFYEIDPAIVQIAQNSRYFTYYDDGQKRGVDLKVMLGDARLSLEQEDDHSYELIILDAFSSDAIPVHLITCEAIALYFKKLTVDGILAIHISNRYLKLEPVLGNLEKELHLIALKQFDDTGNEEFPGKSASDWVILAKRRAAFGGLVNDARWTPLVSNPNVGVWTDDFSNVFSVFDWSSRR